MLLEILRGRLEIGKAPKKHKGQGAQVYIYTTDTGKPTRPPAIPRSHTHIHPHSREPAHSRTFRHTPTHPDTPQHAPTQPTRTDRTDPSHPPTHRHTHTHPSRDTHTHTQTHTRMHTHASTCAFSHARMCFFSAVRHSTPLYRTEPHSRARARARTLAGNLTPASGPSGQTDQVAKWLSKSAKWPSGPSFSTRWTIRSTNQMECSGYTTSVFQS